MIAPVKRGVDEEAIRREEGGKRWNSPKVAMERVAFSFGADGPIDAHKDKPHPSCPREMSPRLPQLHEIISDLRT